MPSSLFPNAAPSKINPQMMSNIKNLMGMFQGKGDPKTLIQNVAAQNPQMQGVLKMINESGMSPKDLFMKKAKEAGINPDDIISQLK